MVCRRARAHKNERGEGGEWYVGGQEHIRMRGVRVVSGM